jgi:hypothetical protein
VIVHPRFVYLYRFFKTPQQYQAIGDIQIKQCRCEYNKKSKARQIVHRLGCGETENGKNLMQNKIHCELTIKVGVRTQEE